MAKLKANFSKWIHQRWPAQRAFGCETGYAGFGVSASRRRVVRTYIARQEAHHRKMTYQDEVLALLTKPEIDYDPRYGLD